MRTTESVDRAAARAQTNVETIFGLMPDKRASRGLVEHALTVRPSVVRSRNHVSAMSVIGTMIRIDRSEPRTVTPATVQVPLMALGKWVVIRVGVGILMAIAKASCDTPMVATRTTTRGDLRSRRMMARSTTAPKASPENQGDHEPHPERHVVLHDQQREDGGADDAHVADGEVDDPGGPVDQDHADGDDGDAESLHDAVENDLAVQPGHREHQSASWPPRNTARARSSRSIRSRI